MYKKSTRLLSWLFIKTYSYLEKRDAVKNYSYGYPLIRSRTLGISFLSRTNDGGIVLYSRFPRTSIVWTKAIYWYGADNFSTSTQTPVYRSHK